MDEATKTKIESLLKEIHGRVAGHSPDSMQTPYVAELQVVIAEEQAKAAEKIERQTNKLIGLTWALVFLTLALFLLTVYLSYDAYFKNKSHDKAYPNATQ